MKTSLLARWFVTILMGVALTTGLTGCIGGDDDPVDPGTGGAPAALVGTWTFQTVTLDGQPQDLADWFEWQAETVSAHVIINGDYTQRFVELDAQSNVVYYDSGVFTVDGQNLTVTVNSENGSAVTAYTTFEGSWLVVGSLLTMTMVDGGHTVVMALAR